jgi:hypothetical protein
MENGAGSWKRSQSLPGCLSKFRPWSARRLSGGSPPSFFERLNAPARSGHAHAERFRRAELRAEQVARAARKIVVVVKAGRAAVI